MDSSALTISQCKVIAMLVLSLIIDVDVPRSLSLEQLTHP